jgi:O-antigen/teichoic acid export membrane protein
MTTTICSENAPAAPAPAAPKTSVRSNFIWTLVGNVGYAGAQWAIVIILAKLTTPEVVGEYALGLAMVTPVLMLVNLQLRTVLMTDVHQEYSFAHYLGFRLATTAAALVSIAILGARMQGSWQHFLTIVLIGVAQGVEAVSDIYYGLMQVRDRMDRIAISMIGRAVLSLAALTVTLWTTRSLLWGVVALTVARLAVLAGYDARRRTHDPAPDEALQEFWPPRWSFRLQRKLCGSGLPLGIVALLLALNTMIPRYFLEASLGPRGVGIFAAIAFLPNSGSLLIFALGQSAFVPLARYYTKGDLAGFLRLLLQLLGIGLVIGLGGIAFAALLGRPLLTLLYRPEYAEHADLLPWFMTAAGLGYLGQLIGSSVTAARYFRSQIPLFAMVSGTIALCCYLLVPRTGLQGAVTATLIGMAVQLAGCVALLVWSLRRTGEQGCRA